MEATGLGYLAAGIGAALTVIGAGLGIGKLAAAAMEASGVGSPVDETEEAYAACGDSYPDRDGYAMWGNSCGGDADEL